MIRSPFWFAFFFVLFPAAVLVTSFGAANAARAQDTAVVDQDVAEPNITDPAVGQGNQGQADLDEAMILRIDADTPEKLDQITTLVESSLAKGLGDESKSFAKKMLASIQFERAQNYAAQIMQGGGRRLSAMRKQAMESLREAVENDPGLVEAYMLIGRLNLLPEGDAEEVRKAATKAIELLADDPAEQSTAYVLRALRQESDEAKMADLEAAVKADPSSIDALQARASMRMIAGDVNGAIEDLQLLLKQDPTNQAVAQAAVEQLVRIDRVDDALKLLSDALQANPNEGLYRLRGIIYRTEGKDTEAMEDFNKALAMQPKDPLSLLQRAEISIARSEVKEAKRDLKEAIRVAPQVADSVAAVRIRCYIAAAENRMTDAINDMKLLVDAAPGEAFWKLQLGNFYLADKRPSMAIEVADEVLKDDDKNVSALRLRADTLLGLGDHAGAIQDYQKAVEYGIDSVAQKSGVLNNLAWVLATSPKDDVRNGELALKYGEQAAELTEFKEAHILSTLAAAYAEKGDFDQAKKWSEKAVELGREEKNEQLDQLELELKSYQDGKPWREEQETEENNIPLLAPEDLIDT